MATTTWQELTLGNVITEFYDQNDMALEGPRTIDFIMSKPKVLEVEITDAMEKGLIPKPPATVLDLGSGNGLVVAMFAAKGYNAYGIEIQKPLVQRAREHAAKIGARLTFAAGNYFPRDVRQKIKDDYHVRLRDTPDPYTELGREFGSFDLIFNYPFPTQVPAIFQLFGDYARKGQILMLFGNESRWKFEKHLKIERIGPEADIRWYTAYQKK